MPRGEDNLGVAERYLYAIIQLMADLLVRHLDRSVLDRLKARARRHGRSLQSEAKLLLERAAQAENLDRALADLRQGRAALGRMFDDSTELIREDRDR